MYQVGSDLLLDNALPIVPQKKRTEPLWSPIWLPSEHKKRYPDLTIEGCRCTEHKLKMLGKQLTISRAWIRTKAQELLQQDQADDEVDQKTVMSLAARMNRGYFAKRRLLPKGEVEIPEDTPSLQRKRGCHSRLTMQEIIQIADRVIIGKELYKDVAKELRTTVSRVSFYVSKVKKNPKYLSELLSKRDESLAKR